MQSFKLAPPHSDGDTYHCIADTNVLVLKDRYDERQFWLSFDGITILFRTNIKTVSSKTETSERITGARRDRPLRPTAESMQTYIPETGVDQYILPMPEWQFPSKTLSAKIRKAEYPAFDRDERGDLYSLKYNHAVRDTLRSIPAVKEWIAHHCAGRVILTQHAVFEKADDAILAMVSGDFSKL